MSIRTFNFTQTGDAICSALSNTWMYLTLSVYFDNHTEFLMPLLTDVSLYCHIYVVARALALIDTFRIRTIEVFIRR